LEKDSQTPQKERGQKSNKVDKGGEKGTRRRVESSSISKKRSCLEVRAFQNLSESGRESEKKEHRKGEKKKSSFLLA